MRSTAFALIAITSWAHAFQANPLSTGQLSHAGATTTSSTLSVSGFTDRNTWATAAGGSPTMVNFDSLADGTLITGTGALSAFGIQDSFGFCTYLGIVTSQYVYCSCTLPFPMFIAGTLPTEPNYFSNDNTPSVFATGEFTLVFSQPTTACGAYVADQSPLAGFTIEVFDSGGSSPGFDQRPAPHPSELLRRHREHRSLCIGQVQRRRPVRFLGHRQPRARVGRDRKQVLRGQPELDRFARGHLRLGVDELERG